ncbi:GLL7 protein, partial [Eudromia elegans]|nr:GLL7 protein [Eudromia elegans]
MRILYLLLVALFLVVQGVAGKPFFPTSGTCQLQNGFCFPGICRRPYYWIGTCNNGYSCCRRYAEI